MKTLLVLCILATLACCTAYAPAVVVGVPIAVTSLAIMIYVCYYKLCRVEERLDDIKDGHEANETDDAPAKSEKD